MATRTAPTVDGTGFSYIKTSLRWMDASGDVRTDSYQFDPTATPAEIEAFAATAQLISNATLYEIVVGEVYASVGDAQNADALVWENVRDNLVIQAKNATAQSIRAFLPSPASAIFIGDTENIDPTDVALGNFMTAFVALLPAGYSIVGARFTHRRQINKQIKI